MFSPIDLETKEFKKTAFGGYSRDDIDEFFTMLFQDYKSLYMENIALNDKLKTLTNAVTKYKSMEDVLQNTLIVAQTTSDELKKAANDRSNLIIEEAENRARSIVLDAEEKANEANLRLTNTQLQISNFKRQTLAALQGIVDMVSNIPEETERNGK